MALSLAKANQKGLSHFGYGLSVILTHKTYNGRKREEGLS